MELGIRLCVVITLLGLGAAQSYEQEKALVAKRLLSLLQGEQQMIERQSDHQLDEEESGKDSVQWDNSLNRPLKVECNTEKGEALIRVRSKFSKKDGDRQFKWDCRGITEGAVPLMDCEWSKEVNKWNGPISFVCPADHVMAGIKSKSHESKEDRKWKLKCCKARAHITKSCKISERLNSYRGDIDYWASRSRTEPSVFVGIQSLENPKDDREWQVFECNFGTPKCPQFPQYLPIQYHAAAPLGDPPSYNIVLDVNKPPPPPPPPPQPHTYTLHTEPVPDMSQYSIEIDPEKKKNHKLFSVKENSLSQKKRGQPKLLPVPPGMKKHPDPPPQTTPRWPPNPPATGHVIEIVPQPYGTSHNKFPPPNRLPYNEQSSPGQSDERHIHIYPPPGNSPGHFTVFPNSPNSGTPRIHYSEPPRPLQKTHYHLRLPARQEPKVPREIHYNVPIPSSDGSYGNGVRYRVPIPGGLSGNAGKNDKKKAIGLLRELVQRRLLLNSKEVD